MSTVILTCAFLKDYVAAAQRSQGTNYPVEIIDRKYHVDPPLLREKVIEAVNALPPEVDTVLVSMGFCGGAWHEVSFDRRVVIPRVDDCITLLMHTDDTYCPNLKEQGHLYVADEDPSEFSVEKMLKESEGMFEGKSRDDLFHIFFDDYRFVDIVDTGYTDCYEESYVEAVQSTADAIGAEVTFVPGSNIILEKLVSGRWDEQFLVCQPGGMIRHGDFFD
ncbi:MAG: DUF1638 domain-containing protein [Oscillospiraceae bacterium]|nr:DUF1638 domain-containing protein [Oscillospiraceae bacterium]